METAAQEPQFESSEIDAITREFKVTLGGADIESRYQKEFGKYAKNVKIDGFRPGKAPRQIIEKMYGNSIRAEITEEMINESVQKILIASKLPVVGVQPVRDLNRSGDASLTFSFRAELYPEPTIAGYDSFEVTVPNFIVTDDAVNKAVDKLVEPYADYADAPADGVVRPGDVIWVKLSTSLKDAQEGAAPQVESLPVVLPHHLFPDALNNELIGKKKGESAKVEANFPDQHPDEELRGNPGVFEAEVTDLRYRSAPKLDDELAKKIEPSIGSAADLVKSVRGKLEARAKQIADEEKRAAVIKLLIEKNQFPVPGAMVASEVEAMVKRFGLDPETMPQERRQALHGQLGEVALERIRSYIAIQKVAQQEKLEPTEEEITKELEKYECKAEDHTGHNHQTPSREDLADSMKRDKALSLLVERAKVTYLDKSEEINDES